MGEVQTCRRCGEDPPVPGEGVCRFCRGELREAAISHLLSTPPERTFAIWHLLDEGYAKEAVLGAVKAASRGYGREIVAGLLEAANA